MDVGKLPNDLLATLLGKVQSRDPRVVLGPGIGRDAAVIDNGGPKLLVAKTDPVTFASDLIGWYAVNVNANDIACMGARPAWLMATILLPDGASAELAEAIFDQVTQACRRLRSACRRAHRRSPTGWTGDRRGRTAGEVERDRLVRARRSSGDASILTKGIAIEATVLAREAADELRRAGMTPAEIEAGKAYIFEPGISVVKEAIAAGKAVRVHAMHDPTEGGLATALYEMAAASETGMSVRGAYSHLADNAPPVRCRRARPNGATGIRRAAAGGGR
jgi:hydrogenase maturation factor